MSKLVFLTALLLSACLASELQAELVTMSFTATISEVVGNPLGINLTGGEPVTGTFTYDTASTSRNPPVDTHELYTQTGGASTFYTVTIDRSTVLTPFTDDWYVSIINRPETEPCGFGFGNNESWAIGHGAYPAGVGSVAVNGVENKSVGIRIGFSACSADALPGTLALLPNPIPSFEEWDSDFDGRIFGGTVQDDDNPFSDSRFNLEFTSFQVVPEPSTLALGYVALLCSWLIQRGRGQTRR